MPFLIECAIRDGEWRAVATVHSQAQADRLIRPGSTLFRATEMDVDHIAYHIQRTVAHQLFREYLAANKAAYDLLIKLR